jgi:hypothetical protein
MYIELQAMLERARLDMFDAVVNLDPCDTE